MRQMYRCAFAALAFSGVLSAIAMPAAAIPADNVVLRAMDKITARVSTVTVPVGDTVAFGSLQITVRACDKRPPEETPEAAAFLEVVEERPGEAPQPRFNGWMFASSPALSALEHPVYDLWVLDCSGGEDQAVEPAPAESESSTTESGTNP